MLVGRCGEIRTALFHAWRMPANRVPRTTVVMKINGGRSATIPPPLCSWVFVCSAGASWCAPTGWHQAIGQRGLICLKKSLPLLSTRMNAGKSSTSIFQMASMPSSGYSSSSTLLIEF